MAKEVEEASRGTLQMHPTAFTKMEREHERRNLRLNEAYYIASALGTSIFGMMSSADLLTPAENLRGLQELIDGARETRALTVDALAMLTSQISDLEREFAAALSEDEADSATEPSGQPLNKVEIFQTRGRKWRVRLVNADGEVIADVGPFQSKADAEEIGLNTLKADAERAKETTRHG